MLYTHILYICTCTPRTHHSTAGQVSNFLIKDSICDRTMVTLYYLSMVLTMLASMIGTARTELTTVATAVDGDTATAEEAVETSSSGTIGRGWQVLWPTARGAEGKMAGSAER